jgi:hypothetical protein
VTTRPHTQEELRAEAARRIRRAAPGLAARHDLSTTRGLLAAHEEATAGARGDGAVRAVVVIRRFDPAVWLRGTCAFALGLAPDIAEAWRAAFTRTIFLTGNPANLAGRFTFDHVADDGSAAWIAPGPPEATDPLRRLLKLFDATRGLPGAPAPTRAVAGGTPAHPDGHPARRYRIHLATAGLTLSDHLVTLNHLLAEAALEGRLRPGDRLTLHRVPRLAELPRPLAALRVAADRAHPDRLRAYACLTEENPAHA